MQRKRTVLATAGAVVLVAGCAAVAETDIAGESAEEVSPPFSGPANVEYAGALWNVLEERELVGPQAIQTYPYEGQAPHGQVLEYLDTEVTVAGHTGYVMVKKNFAAQDMDVEELERAILDDPRAHLGSVTVMFRREQGYDPEHANWFWAKYQPDGSLATNPKGMKLGGRVAKGADQGCIACHQGAPGGDYIFSHDRTAKR